MATAIKTISTFKISKTEHQSSRSVALLLKSILFLEVVVFLLYGGIYSEAKADVLSDYYISESQIYPDQSEKIIEIRIPGSFIRRKAKPQRVFGVNFLYWPRTKSGAFEQNNLQYGVGCSGECGGRLLIHIDNFAHTVSRETFADFLFNQSSKWAELVKSPNVVFSISHVDVLTDLVTRTVYEPTSSLQIVYSKESSVYHRRKVNGPFEDFFQCIDNSSKVLCSLKFSLPCEPAMVLTASWISPSSTRSDLDDLEQNISNLISPWVNKPECKAAF